MFLPEPTETTAPTAARAAWRRWLPVASLVVGVLLLPTAVLVFRGGITENTFHWPEDTSPAAVVQRYNGAWIAGALGLAILGGMLIVWAVGRLVAARSGSQADTVPADPTWSNGPIPVNGSGPLT